MAGRPLSFGDKLALAFAGLGAIASIVSVITQREQLTRAIQWAKPHIQGPPGGNVSDFPPDPTTSPDPLTPVSADALLAVGDSWSLVGDSLVGGLAAPLGKLTAARGNPFVSTSQPGAHIPDMLANTTNGHYSDADRQVKVAVLCVGSNDAWIQNHFDEGAALQKLVAWFAAKGAQVVCLMPPGTDASVSPQGPNAAYVRSLLISSQGPDGYILADAGPIPISPEPHPVHPTAAGYQQLASDLFYFLTTPAPA